VLEAEEACKSDTRKAARTTGARGKTTEGFTAEERAAMRDRAQEIT